MLQDYGDSPTSKYNIQPYGDKYLHDALSISPQHPRDKALEIGIPIGRSSVEFVNAIFERHCSIEVFSSLTAFQKSSKFRIVCSLLELNGAVLHFGEVLQNQIFCYTF